jgi:squalene monooxygenase
MRARAEAAAAAAPAPPSSGVRADCDVAIIGMGIAGSALAAALARRGRRVVVVEAARELRDTVKGELLQPGGIRALERMGLAAAAKSAEVDGVRVDGYVCITPDDPAPSSANAAVAAASAAAAAAARPAHAPVVLSYPTADPSSSAQFFGLLGARAPPPLEVVTRENAARVATPGTVCSGVVDVCPSSGRDTQPRGRSFHHIRFVAGLRRLALAERNVGVRWGRATGLVSARELPELARARALAAGADAAAADAAARAADAGAGTAGAGSDPERVVGVRWCSDASTGAESTVLARLTIVCDGMFSQMRSAISEDAAAGPRKVSMFCGLVLHHAPHDSPLPFPNRGECELLERSAEQSSARSQTSSLTALFGAPRPPFPAPPCPFHLLSAQATSSWSTRRPCSFTKSRRRTRACSWTCPPSATLAPAVCASTS